MNFAPNGHLKGHFGIEKAQLIQPLEAILRPFLDYDELEYKNPNHSSSSSKGGDQSLPTPLQTPLLLKEGVGVVKQANIKHFYFAVEAL